MLYFATRKQARNFAQKRGMSTWAVKDMGLGKNGKRWAVAVI